MKSTENSFTIEMNERCSKKKKKKKKKKREDINHNIILNLFIWAQKVNKESHIKHI